jgi:hypothetical protein
MLKFGDIQDSVVRGISMVRLGFFGFYFLVFWGVSGVRFFCSGFCVISVGVIYES